MILITQKFYFTFSFRVFLSFFFFYYFYFFESVSQKFYFNLLFRVSNSKILFCLIKLLIFFSNRVMFLTRVLSFEFCKIFKNTSFKE